MERLPRINNHKEADFGLVVRRHIEKEPFDFTFTLELKDTRGKKSFNMRELKQEQINFGLKKIKLVRNRDEGGVSDYTYHYGDTGIVAIRYPQGFVFITMETISLVTTKSLSWIDADKVAIRTVVKNHLK